MNKLVKLIRRAPTVKWTICLMNMMSLLLLASCHSDTDAVLSDTASIRVVFRLYLPSADTSSTSSKSSEDERMMDNWESGVDPSRLHIVLYTPAGMNVGALENVVLVRTAEPNVYDVTGNMLMSKLLLDGDKFEGQIMVYANMDGVNEQADFSEEMVNQLTFSQKAGIHYIPMWGIKRLNISLVAGRQTDIGTINMLRAEAKIHVELRQDMQANYELSQVELSEANQSGCCLPLYANLCNLQDVQLLDHTAFAHFLSDGQKVSHIDMSHGAIYVPEYENNGKAQAAYISLTLRDKRDGHQQQYELPFVEYDDNGAPTDVPVDIIRNHYYHFTVYKGEDDMLAIQLKVRSWYYVQHDDILM